MANSELYDPITGSFAPTKSLVQARVDATAVALQDGRVLVLGGQEGYGYSTAAELYVP